MQRKFRNLILAGVVVYMFVFFKLQSCGRFPCPDTVLEENVITPKYQPSYQCFKPSTDIVILVLSKQGRFVQRGAIRNTWANAIRYTNNTDTQTVSYLFVTGKGTIPLLDVEKGESEEHDDMLVGNFEDSGNIYANTLKFILGVRWILRHNCYNSNIAIVNTFDDFHVNVTLLSQTLLPKIRTTNTSDKFWIGEINDGGVPNRNRKSQWYLPFAEFRLSKLPQFCTMEAGFVVSYAAAKYLYYWSWNHKIVRLLDVYIGQAAKDGRWEIMRNTSVIPEYHRSRDLCPTAAQTITIGLDSPSLLYSYFNKIRDESRLLQCSDPDLDLVLRKNVSNDKLFQTSLNFTVNPLHVCSTDNGKDVFLLMLISSLPEHTPRRNAIRETWGRTKVIQDHLVQVLFVVGQSTSPAQNSRLKLESDVYRDLIILDFMESHFNLTLKVIAGLKWVTEYCKNIKFLYKGDDDMFVNLDIIVAHLEHNETTSKNGTLIPKVLVNKTITKEKLFLGNVNLSPVVRDKKSKFYVSEKDYRGKYFPPFLSGGGYIISADVIPAMYNASFSVWLINCDDVYQGILSKVVGVKAVHHKGFKINGGRFSICATRKDIWVIHGFYNSKLKNFWKKFVSPSEDCKF